MIALLDGDLLAYRCAASCEKQGVVTEDFGIANARMDHLITRILDETEAEDFKIYLSGDTNFRMKINPDYKANRVDVIRPKWLEPLKQALQENYNAVVADNCEADDLMGQAQTEHSIICTLDKDLRQVPGWHYSWEIQGTGSTGKPWVRPSEKLHVSPQEGLFNFYWQLIMGDASDNVFGFDGKARQKVPKFLEEWYHYMQSMEDEQSLFEFVREKYNDDSRFLMNGACLYIQRQPEENWLDHAQSIMEGLGQKDGSTRLSYPLLGPEPDDGNPNTTP